MTPLLPILHAGFFASQWRSYRAFSHALSQPEIAQTNTFEKLKTEVIHPHLHPALSLRDFQDALPITRYEDYQRAIDAGERNTRAPILRYEHSGGSSGAHKLLPQTQPFLDELSRALSPWLHDLYRQFPSLFLGPQYWAISPRGANRNSHHRGIPIGADDDESYFPPVVRRAIAHVLLKPNLDVGDDALKTFRFRTLLCLLRAHDLRLLSVWSPTFLTLLLDAFSADREALLRTIHDGEAHHRPMPARAKALERASNFAEVWPQLAVVSMWADASAAHFAHDVMRRLPHARLQNKGLLSCEGVVTLPFLGRTPVAVRSHVYEFIDEDALTDRPRLVHELVEGKSYQVLLSTSAGLLRYATGDRVRVDGFLHRTPSLLFVGRAHSTSDLVGEKLAAAFVEPLVVAACEAHGQGSVRFVMLTPHDDRRGYALWLEADTHVGSAIADAVERGLCAGHPYAYARDLGQLQAVRVVHVEAGLAHYERECVRRGQRPGDIKPVLFHPDVGWHNALYARTV